MLQSVNNNIVCAPFEDKAPTGSVKLLPSRADLKALKVLINTIILNSRGEQTHVVKAGDTLYVTGDVKSAPWAIVRKCPAVVDKDNREIPFVLVPFSECYLINTANG